MDAQASAYHHIRRRIPVDPAAVGRKGTEIRRHHAADPRQFYKSAMQMAGKDQIGPHSSYWPHIGRMMGQQDLIRRICSSDPVLNLAHRQAPLSKLLISRKRDLQTADPDTDAVRPPDHRLIFQENDPGLFQSLFISRIRLIVAVCLFFQLLLMVAIGIVDRTDPR